MMMMLNTPLSARGNTAARNLDTSPSPVAKPRVITQAHAANDTRGNRAQRRRLRLRKLSATVAKVELTASVRATFDARMNASDAAAAGRRLTTLDVLADVVDGLSPAVVRAVMDNTIPGFGPLALRYTMDLAVELDGRYALRVAHQQRQAASSVAFVVGADAVHAQRSTLAARLDDALTADAPERAALARVSTEPKDTLDQALSAIDSLVEIAELLFARAESDPGLAAFLEDQRFTRAEVDALLSPVDTVIEARDTRRDAADEAQVEQQAIDELEGRVRDQLLRVRRCVERARADGAKLTRVRLTRVRATGSAKTAKEPAKPDNRPEPQPA